MSALEGSTGVELAHQRFRVIAKRRQSGGPCRDRTYDPLIKRHPPPFCTRVKSTSPSAECPSIPPKLTAPLHRFPLHPPQVTRPENLSKNFTNLAVTLAISQAILVLGTAPPCQVACVTHKCVDIRSRSSVPKLCQKRSERMENIDTYVIYGMGLTSYYRLEKRETSLNSIGY